MKKARPQNGDGLFCWTVLQHLPVCFSASNKRGLQGSG